MIDRDSGEKINWQEHLSWGKEGLRAYPNEKDKDRTLATRRCVSTCLANGWAPKGEEVYKLVSLREGLMLGAHQEAIPNIESLRRLGFVKFLYDRGMFGG